MNLATPFMAKTKPGKKDLDSYTIKGTNKVVRGEFFFLLVVRVESESLVFVFTLILPAGWLPRKPWRKGRELTGVCLVLPSEEGLPK